MKIFNVLINFNFKLEIAENTLPDANVVQNRIKSEKYHPHFKKLFIGLFCISFGIAAAILFLLSFKAHRKESNNFEILPRSAWHAMKPKTNLSELALPVDRYVIAHTASTNCSTKVRIKLNC